MVDDDDAGDDDDDDDDDDEDSAMTSECVVIWDASPMRLLGGIMSVCSFLYCNWPLFDDHKIPGSFDDHADKIIQ